MSQTSHELSLPEDLNVDIGENRSYPIRYIHNTQEALQQLISANKEKQVKTAVITDINLEVSQPEIFDNVFPKIPTFAVSPGEPTKCLEKLGAIWDFLANMELDRKGTLIAFGGGVIGDLGGFAAATYLRGINYYQVPTTLLAMVDSSIGGKTGINIDAGKNLVGAFYHPQEVIIDTTLLKTLPTREFSAGMAEVIKYGMLGDLDLFKHLEGLGKLHPEHPELPSIIRRCCEIKARIVKEDERENANEGGRALLNLGHTYGHAIEQVAGYGSYLHGEAVAIGLYAAVEMSAQKGWLAKADVQRVVDLLQKYDLPIHLNASLSQANLIEAMQRDKKVRQGSIRFVAMSEIGNSFTTQDISREIIAHCLVLIGAN
jgi:3-dehydroquinate synthase